MPAAAPGARESTARPPSRSVESAKRLAITRKAARAASSLITSTICTTSFDPPDRPGAARGSAIFLRGFSSAATVPTPAPRMRDRTMLTYVGVQRRVSAGPQGPKWYRPWAHPAQSALGGRRAARSTRCSVMSAVVSAARNLPRLIQADAAAAVAATGGGIGIGIGIGGTS